MPGNTKQCPYCAETIKAEAKICRFCGRDLTVPFNLGQSPVWTPPPTPPPAPLPVTSLKAYADSSASAAKTENKRASSTPGCFKAFLIVAGILVLLTLIGALLPKTPSSQFPGAAQTTAAVAPASTLPPSPTHVSATSTTNPVPSSTPGSSSSSTTSCDAQRSQARNFANQVLPKIKDVSDAIQGLSARSNQDDLLQAGLLTQANGILIFKIDAPPCLGDTRLLTVRSLNTVVSAIDDWRSGAQTSGDVKMDAAKRSLDIARLQLEIYH